jgi:hypothetical protein
MTIVFVNKDIIYDLGLEFYRSLGWGSGDILRWMGSFVVVEGIKFTLLPCVVWGSKGRELASLAMVDSARLKLRRLKGP